MTFMTKKSLGEQSVIHDLHPGTDHGSEMAKIGAGAIESMSQNFESFSIGWQNFAILQKFALLHFCNNNLIIYIVQKYKFKIQTCRC